MTKEKKQEFQLRITQANSVELIIILYEMAIEYIDEAIMIFEKKADGVELPLACARDCIEEMQHSLDFKYSLAKNLKDIYLYIKKILRDCSIRKSNDNLYQIRDILKGLKESYEQIKDQDNSAPLMENTQKIMSGLTYGRQGLNEIDTESYGRGFTV